MKHGALLSYRNDGPIFIRGPASDWCRFATRQPDIALHDGMGYPLQTGKSVPPGCFEVIELARMAKLKEWVSDGVPSWLRCPGFV
jgi:hypothetical protein